MFRRFYSKSVLLIGVAGVSMVSGVQAQEYLPIRAESDVSRVIQLRNQIQSQAGEAVSGSSSRVGEAVSDFSSRADRYARNPIAIAAPPAPSKPITSSKPKVAYDEIGSAQPLSSQKFASPQPIAKPTIDRSGGGEFAPKVYVQSNDRFDNSTSTPSAAVTAPVRSNEMAPFVRTNISAPEFVNVNEPATVKIDVTNGGKSIVHDVTLIATLPANVRVESRNGNFVDGMCTFRVDTLRPGEKRQLTMDIVTAEKRPLDIRTELVMSSNNQVKVGVRQPQLVVSIEGPKQTNIGSKTTHIVTVSNVGDGTAKNVNLVADIPEALRVVEKSGFERPETIRPGQKVTAKIVSVPRKSGPLEMSFVAEGKSCKADLAQAGLRVTQPELRVAAIGPDMNFVERNGIYTINVDNPGEVDIHNVKVQFVIPDGVKVTTISRQAKMDSTERTLTWNFDEIKAQGEQSIQLKAVATSEGEKFSRIRIASDETNEKEVSLKTMIATRAELGIQMKNIGGPVQVGTEATFVVMVENRGSSTANDLEIEVQLPAGVEAVNPKGGIADKDANKILFSDSSLAAGKTREFRFSALGVARGEHIVRSSLETPNSKQRILVENSVFVYEPAQARVSESLQPTIPR